MDNPFVTKGYAGADYFCDRVKETRQLVELTANHALRDLCRLARQDSGETT